MVKNIITLFFVFYANLVFTQEYNVELYNKYKYQAEEFILKEDYSKALNVYIQLDKEYDIWNADLRNSLLTALLCKNRSYAEYFILELIKRGATNDYLYEKYGDYELFNLIDLNNQKFQEVKSEVDYAVRKKIQEMHQRDQINRSDEDIMLLNDFKNSVVLNSMIIDSGFPTEIDIGIDLDYDKAGFNHNLVYIILVHLVKLNPFEFGQLLPELYLEGKLTGKQFIYLMSFARTCDDSQLSCFPKPPSNILIVDDTVFSCNDEERKRINNNRKKYYLEPIENQVKKTLFRRQSKHKWLISEGFAEFNYNKKKYTYEEFKAKLKEDGLIPIKNKK